MKPMVTLILILHNRHRNLSRLLEYYKQVTFPIIVADSSIERYNPVTSSPNVEYVYTPGLSFTSKIEFVLNKVATPYVLMCADDDFIIPESVMKCIDFLENNRDYSVVQGVCINYNKKTIGSNIIEYSLIYRNGPYDIESNDPMERLHQMFHKYRSFLYAVHRTNILKETFAGAGEVIKNLYLNEYLTAVNPILRGKYRELDVLYQVREYAEDSDDKVTDNLDTIFSQNKYRSQLEGFLQLLTEQASKTVSLPSTVIKENLYQILEQFSRSNQVGLHPVPLTWKKRIGNLVTEIPVMGKKIIAFSRKREREKSVNAMLRMTNDHENLARISFILNKWSV